MARPEKIHLGQILIRHNLISPEDLKLSLEEQKRTGSKLGQILVQNSYATEIQIYEALSYQLNVPLSDINQFYKVI